MKRKSAIITFLLGLLLANLWVAPPVVWAEDTTATSVERAKAALASGRASEAIEILSRLISSMPESDLYYQRGLAYSANSMQNAAINDFDKAISMDPTQAAYYFRRGLSWYRQGHFQKRSR